ncbi:MAG: type II toxin-antitoxin system HicA family toxin [Acidobacteriota bacterium]
MLLPAVTSAQVIRALHKAGFQDDQDNGEHVVLWNPMTGARTVVPKQSGKKDKRPLLRAIVQDARMTIRDFLKLI